MNNDNMDKILSLFLGVLTTAIIFYFVKVPTIIIEKSEKNEKNIICNQ